MQFNQIDKIMNNIFQKNLLLLFLGIGSTLLFLTAFNSFYWMDDFWKRYDVLHKGLFSFQKEIYLNWDGRAVSPLYLFRNILLALFDWKQAWVITFFGILSILFCSYFILRIVSSETWHEKSKIEKAIAILLLTLVLILVFRPHLSRSLYWGTGSYYIFANCLLFGAIWCFIAQPKSILSYFLLIASASSGPNNGMFLLVFLLLNQYFNGYSILNTHFVLAIILIFISLLLISFAPGNFSRGGNDIDLNISNIVIGGFSIFKEYILMSKWAIYGGFIIAIVLPAKIIQTNKKIWVSILASSLATITPFLFIPSAASKHTAIFFQTGILLMVLVVLSICISKYILKSWIKNMVGMIFSIYFIFIIIEQLQLGREVKIQMDERYSYLESFSGSKGLVVLNKINIQDRNWVSRFWDIEEDSTYFNNRYHQRYFNTGPIILKKTND